MKPRDDGKLQEEATEVEFCFAKEAIITPNLILDRPSKILILFSNDGVKMSQKAGLFFVTNK